jgi:hypothetical protein
MYYSGRKLTDVSVFGLQGGPMADGTYGVSGTVRVQISAIDGSDAGPSFTVDFAVSSRSDATIADAEKDLLGGALALLKRVSLEPLDSLIEALSRTRQESFVRPTGLK